MSKGGKQQQVVDIKPTFNMAAVGDSLENAFAELPTSVQRRVKAIKNIHKEHLDLEKKYREEVTALDRKYQDLYAPLFLKRATVVKGEHEPTDAEAHIEGEDDVKVDEKADKNIKGIPNFWLTVMQNNRSVGETITEADEEALAYLQDIRYARMDGDKHGFQITFHFAENPYFTDSVLTKTYHLVDEDNIFGELVFDHAEGCPIKWKPSKNLTVKLVKKTQKPRGGKGGKRGGGGGAGRVITTEEPCDSFFQFFTPPSRENEDEEDEEGMVDDMLEADFEMGVIFKDKLVPHSVLWFTGEALDYEDDDYGDFDFDDEFGDEDDEDDEDDDEDDEEEEEEEKPRKGRGGNQQQGGKKGGPQKQLPPSGKPGAPGQPQQPECKQQ